MQKEPPMNDAANNDIPQIDDIEIKHVAHNRKGFALGSVLAAEWVKGKKGWSRRIRKTMGKDKSYCK